MLWFLRAQLFLHLLSVVRMNLGVEAGAVPVALRVIEDRCNRVGDVDDPSSAAAHDEQESVGCLQDQVLQLLVGEERRLVRVVRASVPCT